MTADIFTNLTNHFAGTRRFCLLWVAEQNGGALEFCTRNFLAIVHRQIQAKVVHRTDRTYATYQRETKKNAAAD